MQATGVSALDQSVEHSIAWVDEVCAELGDADRAHGWIALRAVLQHVRDLVGADEALQLAAQLPYPLRGLFFDGWNPRRPVEPERDVDVFLCGVECALASNRVDAADAARAVFAVLARRLDGEAAHIRGRLAAPVQALWPTAPRTVRRPSDVSGRPRAATRSRARRAR